MVTNPASTKVLAVYAAWNAKLALHVTPTGQKPWTRKMTIAGQMELRPDGSSYRIWNPWRVYTYAGKSEFR